MSIVVVLVLVGAFAKSAQRPLQGWLPAAMVHGERESGLAFPVPK